MHATAPNTRITEQHITFQLLADLKETCRPFFEKTGLSHFCYAVFDFKQEQLTALTTTPRANRYLIDHQSLPKGKELEPGIHYLPTFQQGKERAEILQRFNLSQQLEIIKAIGPGKIEFFSFGTRLDVEDKTNFYFNHLAELHQFGAEFKDRAKDLIAQTQTQPIIVPGYKKFVSPMVSYGLSQRELAVLQGIRNGLTAKQSAAHLNISTRTVESYIENVKNKLGLNRKAQLVKFCLEEHLLV